MPLKSHSLLVSLCNPRSYIQPERQGRCGACKEAVVHLVGSFRTLLLQVKLHLRVLELVMDSVPSHVYIGRHLDVVIVL